MTVEQIARVCHELNRAYCQALGDDSQTTWEEAPLWQRESAISGVEFHRTNPSAGDSSSHDNWMQQKALDGWKYGPFKDPAKKEHPCMVAFDDLPLNQQIKDRLFRQTVHTLSALLLIHSN